MTPGQQISRYRVVRPVGKGGMGEVFEAVDLRLNRSVALKFLPDTGSSPTLVKRFLNEAHLAAQLRHPNICSIYDVEEVDGRVFLVMAMIDGETIREKVRRGGRIPLPKAIQWICEILLGLEAAHSLGIVHRDIKSANIIIDAEDRPTILDFGLAQRSGQERYTVVGQAVGTPAYMAPEQAQGLEVDSRADIWATGIVLFEMLTGKLPSSGKMSLSSSGGSYPASLEAIVAKALQLRPADRWQSAMEMRKAIEGINSDDATQSMVVQVQKQARALPLSPLWLLAFLLLAGLTGAAFFFRLPGAGVSSTTVRRLVLLPLEGVNETQRALGDGLLELMSDSIIQAERAGQRIWVVPVAEVRARKLASPEEARRAYGVDFAVTGKSEAVGNNLRFTLSFIETASLKTIASESFVYDAASPLASKESALRAMRKLLSLGVPSNLKTSSSLPTSSSGGAYGAYIEGRGLMARYDRAGNLDRAIARFADAVKEDPPFASAHAALGEAYWLKAKLMNSNQELTDLALYHARQGVSLRPDLPVVHVKLGEMLSEMGNENEAIASLHKALELSPGDPEASRDLAGIFSNQGNFKEAERLYLEAIQARPSDWFSHLQLAFFYEDRSRLKESEDQLREAGRYAPENESVVRNLGRLYRMEGRYEDAIQQFLRAVQLQPSARAYNSIAFTYYSMHEFRKAVLAAESALALDGTSFQHWGNLGWFAAMSPEDQYKSIPALRRAVELVEHRIKMVPTQHSAKADLAEYLARLGDSKGALTTLDKIPEAARGAMASRVVITFELCGRRTDAIRAVRSYFKNPLTLREVLDEPVLAKLHQDPEFKRAVEEVRTRSSRPL